jgi:hypothetical protein
MVKQAGIVKRQSDKPAAGRYSTWTDKRFRQADTVSRQEGGQAGRTGRWSLVRQAGQEGGQAGRTGRWSDRQGSRQVVKANGQTLFDETLYKL